MNNAFLTLNYTTKTADLTLQDGTLKTFSGSRYRAVKSAITYIRQHKIPTDISATIEQLTESVHPIGPKIERLLF